MAEMKSTVHGRGLLERSPLFAAMDERSRHELVAHAVNPCRALAHFKVLGDRCDPEEGVRREVF